MPMQRPTQVFPGAGLSSASHPALSPLDAFIQSTGLASLYSSDTEDCDSSEEGDSFFSDVGDSSSLFDFIPTDYPEPPSALPSDLQSTIFQELIAVDTVLQPHSVKKSSKMMKPFRMLSSLFKKRGQAKKSRGL